MKPAAAPLALAAALALGGCAVVPPAGPSVLVMPAPGKSFPQFQAEDTSCRHAAAQWVSGEAAQASDAANGNAVLGTLFGAAIGALYGVAAGNPGAGAAIGAGTGLLFGGSAGAGAATVSGAGIQYRYDVTYLQCMATVGNTAPAMASGGGYSYPLYGYPYAPPYGYPWY